MTCPTLYVLCGLPFAGKSTLATAVQARRPAIAVVSLDALMAEAGHDVTAAQPVERWEAASAEAVARARAALDAGRDVLIDDTTCLRFLRDRYRAVADALCVPARVLHVATAAATCRQRRSAAERDGRRGTLPPEVFEAVVAAFEPPAPDEPGWTYLPDSEPLPAFLARAFGPEAPRVLKWIACDPRPEHLAAYHREQAVWNEATFAREDVVAYVEARSGARTLLLVEWPGDDAVARFMRGTHEDLMREHPLAAYLLGFEVAYFEPFDVVGRPPVWNEIAGGTAVLRHTTCELGPEGLAPFLASQQQAWSPGMAAAPGFQGGRLWRRRDRPSTLLVTTYFTDAVSLAGYQRDVLPGLRTAGAASLSACTALRSETWTVEAVRHAPSAALA